MMMDEGHDDGDDIPMPSDAGCDDDDAGDENDGDAGDEDAADDGMMMMV
jgi:hypothetical protein